MDEADDHGAHHLIDGEPAEPLARRGATPSRPGRLDARRPGAGMRVRDDVVRHGGNVLGERRREAAPDAT